MPVIAVASMLLTAAGGPPPCRAGQLRLGAGPREDVADFAPRTGAMLSIRNLGPDCTIPALPTVKLRDRRGRPLPISRRAPPGMRPGPAMAPVELPGGHRATIELDWTPCGSGTGVRCAHGRRVTVRIGPASIGTALDAAVLGSTDGRFSFDQSPARVAEGMAEG